MEAAQCPKFTIVSAVYQVERYLQEAIDSLLGQTLGFSNIQLILVDDGSTDRSPEICEACRAQYPEQVVVLHQPNAGQAAARNHGLQYARGKYICFMDPDDKLATDALEKVWRFFEAHEQETDMVAIPMFFFEASSGPHWQNTKFGNGSRIIDLTQEHKVQQASASSAFFHSRVKELIHFDEKIYNNEDFKVNLRVLAEKQTLGVVADTKYLYRRRGDGNLSTVQQATRSKRWYTTWFSMLCDWACDYYTQRFGLIPPHVQYAVLCDLSWRIVSEYEDDFHQVLTPEEQETYRQAIGAALRRFDDQYLLELPNLTPELCYGLLRLKYGRLPDRQPLDRDVLLHYGDCRVAVASEQALRYEFISVSDGALHIEGLVSLCGMDEAAAVGVQMVKPDGGVIPCRMWRWPQGDLKRLDMTLCAGWRFACDVPLGKGKTQVRPQLCLDGSVIDCARIVMGLFVPLSERLEGDCFREHGWTIARAGMGLCAWRSMGVAYRTKDEFAKWVKLLQLGARKATIYRMLVFALRLLKWKPIWLVADRLNVAGDNGEALYAHLREKHRRRIAAYFVIKQDSPDFQRLAADKHVVPMFSLKHRLLHLLSDCVLSSAGYSMFNHPFDPIMEGYVKDLMVKPFVFLQHGVTKDDQRAYMSREKQGLAGLVSSSPFEHEAFLRDEAYGYTAEQVWLTGMPRYDRLEDRAERIILIMPTWRRPLFGNYDGVRGLWRTKPDFEKSEFVQFYRSLLNHPQLLEAAEKYGYQLLLAPHPNLRQHLSAFEVPGAVHVVDEKTSYSELFARGSLLLTDYSSVAFDFAYLKKPVIYAQFDQESFYAGQVYEKGYFDYLRDGFGPVCADLTSTVEALVSMMQQGCTMPAMYRQRLERFFAYTDRGNSARVAEYVFAMMDSRKKKR